MVTRQQTRPVWGTATGDSGQVVADQAGMGLWCAARQESRYGVFLRFAAAPISSPSRKDAALLWSLGLVEPLVAAGFGHCAQRPSSKNDSPHPIE